MTAFSVTSRDLVGAGVNAPRINASTFMSVQRCSRQILMHGLTLVLTGLVWGFAVPQTPHPRLALGAHIQLVTNGILFIVMATLLLKLPHRVGPRSAGVMVLSAWLTWAMALSEVANAWWGTTQMLPISAQQAGATGGAAWQELIVQLTHAGAGIGLVIGWALLVAGIHKMPAAAGAADVRQG